MKSKMSKKLIAFILCMVLVICNSVSILADTPAPEATTAAQQTKTAGENSDTKKKTTDGTENVSAQSEDSADAKKPSDEDPAPEVKTTEEKKETTEVSTEKKEDSTVANEEKDDPAEVTTKAKADTDKTDEPTTETMTGEQDETKGAEESSTKGKEETDGDSDKKDTEKGTEEEEKTAATTQSQDYNGKYEDETVTISVSAEAGIVPEGAELSVTPIEKTEITDGMSKEDKAEAKKINEQYNLTEKKLAEDREAKGEKLEGFIAYDISFVVGGEEVEPNGDVKVVINFKEAVIPEAVSDDATISVKHLKEMESAEGGVIVEDMSEKVTVQTVEETKVKEIEFTSDDFSIYLADWGKAAKNTPSTLAASDVLYGSVTVGDTSTLFGSGSYDHKWEIKDVTGKLTILSGKNSNQLKIEGISTGTVTINHKYRLSRQEEEREEKFIVNVIDYVKVYVYVAGTDLSDECLDLLGISKDTLDANGYFPAGEIHLDPEFLVGKPKDTEGAALITKQSDWPDLLSSLSGMDTSTLIDQRGFDFPGLNNRYQVDYSKNANNNLPEYYEQAVQDINKSWGSQCSALFRWHKNTTQNNQGHYGFADQSVKYHLDLRFNTKKIKFILGENNINSGEAQDGILVDSRVYITGSEIQDPRNLNIPKGYYFDGYYEDPYFRTPWDGIGTPLNKDQNVYIKLSKYPVLTMTKTFDGLSDEEVNYLIFGMKDGFGWDINYCQDTTHESETGSSAGQTYMARENDIPENFELPDETKIIGGGDFRITAEQFLSVGNNYINNISSINNGSYRNQKTGAILFKNGDGNWVFSVSFEVPATDDDHFYTVFEQHQEIPGYAKINDSNAEWSITTNGVTTDSGIGKFIDNNGNNIYESMSEINSNSTSYNGMDYNEMEDVCIATGAFKKIKITASTTIAFTNHYKGDLDVTKAIGSNNQYNDADNKKYTITIQPAHKDKLSFGENGSNGLTGKSFTYQIMNVNEEGLEKVEKNGTVTLGLDGAFTIQIKPGQIVHFYDMPAIQWKVLEDKEKNAVSGYTLDIIYTDENRGVITDVTHWNGYSSGDTIGNTSNEDGIASVDSAIQNITSPSVNADAVALVKVENTYTPINGDLTITKEVSGVEVNNKEYSFTVSTINEEVAGKSYVTNIEDVIVIFSTVPTNGEYTAAVRFTTISKEGRDGSIEIKDLPIGLYTVEENEEDAAIEGYNLSSVKYKVGDTVSNNVSVVSSSTAQIDVANTYVRQWQLVKISSTPGIDGNKMYLGNAEFTATIVDEKTTYYGKSKDTTGVILWYENNTDGQLTDLIGTMLPNGNYTITETKSPVGYQITNSGWTLEIENGYPKAIKEGTETVEKGTEGSTDTFYLENEVLYDLPSAGGPGIYWYTLSGTLLMAVAALIVYRQKRKREVLLRK